MMRELNAADTGSFGYGQALVSASFFSRACLVLQNPSNAAPSTPEVAPQVTLQVTPQVTGEVTGEDTGEVTGEANLAFAGAMLQGGDRSRLPFLNGSRNLLLANPPSLCSTGSILAGLFLPGLDVFKLKGIFEKLFSRICSPVTLLLPAGIGGDSLCAVEACKQRWSGLEVMADADSRPLSKYVGEDV